jgi:hypothetical protein
MALFVSSTKGKNRLLVDLLVVREDLSADIAPANTSKASNCKTGSKAAPSVSRLEGIRRNRASREGLDTNSGDIVLESHSAVHRKAKGEDGNNASSGKAAGDFSNTCDIAEGTKLDEGTNEEKSVGKTNLNATEEGGDTSAVGREVGEVRSNHWGGGHGGLEHANEGVSVDRLDHLQEIKLYKDIMVKWI